jgi:hypothetical protein
MQILTRKELGGWEMMRKPMVVRGRRKDEQRKTDVKVLLRKKKKDVIVSISPLLSSRSLAS